MKFKLPKFFMVFGLRVKAKLEPKLPSHVAAQYEPLKALISINTVHDNEYELMHSLLHEMGHAMFYRVSINQAVSFETHEFIVNNYATMLLENFDIKPKLK